MTREQYQRVVVVGASLAGVRGAETLRRSGFTGRITLVGAEAHFPPYDRPPLSKQILAECWQPEAGLLRVDDGLDAELVLGRSAVGLDLARKAVLLDGDELPFDGLFVATGATARNPWTRWTPERGVHTLRSLDDCLRLRDALRGAARVAIVGAGFIGCEVAGTCRDLGLDVTLIDTLNWPMLRAVGPEMGEVLAAFHRERGVRLALGRSVAALVGPGFVEGVQLDGDELVEADVVVVATGAAPETRWLEASGLELADGVMCDARGFALGTDTVVAAGDVARWTHPMTGTGLRVEHWTNAVGQAQVAARNLAARLAGAEPVESYATVPYFWSDQHDRKLQYIGFGGSGADGTRVAVELGAVEDGRFVTTYHRDGRLVGALCVNWPAQVPRYRRRIVADWEAAGSAARTASHPIEKARHGTWQTSS
ncbi:FAD/NAD(P)-binding oxidoreductase [Actinospica sp.]|uniref:NAD(P)/FAD-dependent oxidoreductase n=1 Tax=Actinospica sp. TaxID=1872142 RepID=UPI002CFD8FDF|nr:FAD/NAD(P)-binding oxidoreductase [Actinospica sp.]HWG25567.1 FAD/NAD(P)-binding oxidoreductase [Actinospica sp.]